jgi:spore maturation protein CgeB
VLNDHWADMARNGFVSNRLFDAAASGALVVSDRVPGVEDLFAGAVRTYDSVEELRDLVRAGDRLPVAERAARGARIGTTHAFLRRAEVLLDAVRRLRAAG